MTVITIPSAKSDKAPLVTNAADLSSPPPPPPSRPSAYHPKCLEAGVAVAAAEDGNRARFRLMACRAAKAAVVVLACTLLVLFYGHVLCKAYRNAVIDVEERDQASKSYAYVVADGDGPPTVAAPSQNSDADYGDNQPDVVFPKLRDFPFYMYVGPEVGPVDLSSVVRQEFALARRPADVPPVTVTKSARFIHDFSVNVTGIVDVEGKRCFVMPLVRNAVSPPTSLYDLLFKMSSGYYSMDINKVMHNMRVVEPAIKHLSDYGMYISKDCADYSTFKLEKVVSTAV